VLIGIIILSISGSTGSQRNGGFSGPAESREGRTGSTGRGGGRGIVTVAVAGCEEDFVEFGVLIRFCVGGGAGYVCGEGGKFSAREGAVPIHLVECPFVCCAYRVEFRQVEACRHVCKRFEARREWHNAGREVGVSGVVNGANLEGVMLPEGLYWCEDEGDCGCFKRNKISRDALGSAC
jgi:hypothetical protein